jgi:hypothetical protein
LNKIIDNSTTDAVEPKYESRYYNLAGEQYHLTEDEIIELGRDFLKWAKTNKKALKCRKFFRDLGWGLATLTRWIHKYPDFAELYHEGKEEIGDRREELAMSGKIRDGIVIKTLHMYDREYKKEDREQMELKAKLATDSIKTLSESKEYIVMDSFAAISEAMKDKETRES